MAALAEAPSAPGPEALPATEDARPGRAQSPVSPSLRVLVADVQAELLLVRVEVSRYLEDTSDDDE